MLGRLSQRFAGKQVDFGIISESDIEIYVFGFYQIVMLLLNVVTTLILGVAFRLIVPCIILNIAYIVIRKSAGGYHADSPVKCYIYSTLMIAVLLSVIKWIHIPNTVLASMLVISGIVIVILAPVETENNSLDEIEKKVYRKRSMNMVPLCDVPNCTHMNSDCLAKNIGNMSVFYNNCIYYFESNGGDVKETPEGKEFYIDSKLKKATLNSSEIELVCEFHNCVPPDGYNGFFLKNQ